MDLIDRYVAFVGALLPGDQRDDIKTELRDLLLSRCEEKEGALGRPLTRQETEAVLREFGNPVAVAGRYGSQQYLIGPDVFPVYRFVLTIVLLVVLTSAAVTGVVTGAISPRGPAAAIGIALRIAWGGAFGAVGAVTIVFAILERTGASRAMLGAWKPRDLPRPPKWSRVPQWYDHVAAIVVQVVFLAWWTGLLPIHWQPYIAPKPGQSLHFAFASAWKGLYWPILALSAAIILAHALKLAVGSRRRFVYAFDVALHAGIIAVAAAALRAGRWAVVSGSGLPPAGIAAVDRGVNIGAYATLLVIVAASAAALVLNAWRLARPGRPKAGPI